MDLSDLPLEGVSLLTGSETIFRDAISMVLLARRCIRATALHDGVQKNPLKEDYFKALVKRLQEGRRSDLGLEFRVTANESIGPAVLQRATTFVEHGVAESVRIRFTKASVGMAVLVVDNSHMHISFPSNNPDDTLETCFSFRDCPEAVEKIVQWYDNCLWTPPDHLIVKP